jgi:hypothetical protein
MKIPLFYESLKKNSIGSYCFFFEETYWKLLLICYWKGNGLDLNISLIAHVDGGLEPRLGSGAGRRLDSASPPRLARAIKRIGPADLTPPALCLRSTPPSGETPVQRGIDARGRDPAARPAPASCPGSGAVRLGVRRRCRAPRG